MSESFWGTFIIGAGVLIITVIFFMQKVTNTSEQNYTLIKETTEAAMQDAFDYASYMIDGETIRINREVFVESFIRRFSQNASLANTYVVEFYDINEYPPKVSLKVKTKEGKFIGNQEVSFNITNKIDAIYETTE
ncbi:MAG: DUF5411 family protein [Bacilli bacterium]